MIDFTGPVAVLSDVHGNLEALDAVLTDIRNTGVLDIVNLGDCVGYGPNPCECIDLLQASCRINLRGNHDYATLYRSDNFNPAAQAAILFVRQQLQPADNADAARRRWLFLQQLLPMYENADFEFMHGSPRRPITEYILPSDPLCDPFKIDDIFAAMGHRYAFVGHTHYAGVIEEHQESFVRPDELQGKYRLTEKRAIINVGSVGQPRDSDRRAAYVVIHRHQVEWRRVQYKVADTVAKIEAQNLLDDQLARRLLVGQ
ncbi:phosphoesterase [Planctomycetales bacterium]|nr:phosphoesterase [Planctomycetales bacterium]